VEPEDRFGDILEEACFSRHILDTVVNRWASLIFYALSSGPKRYGQLKRMIEGISQTMLTNTLRKLERHGLVSRTVHPVIPPKVEYALTPLGETLVPIFEQIYQWAGSHLEEVRLAEQSYDERAAPSRS
jgi:DNA-binding HxlR family transcriptional regulator